MTLDSNFSKRVTVISMVVLVGDSQHGRILRSCISLYDMILKAEPTIHLSWTDISYVVQALLYFMFLNSISSGKNTMCRICFIT